MQFPVKTGDQIQLDVWSTKALTLWISGFIRKKKGAPEYFYREVPIAASATATLATTFHSVLSEGQLQQLAIGTTTAYVSSGECFVRAGVFGVEIGQPVPLVSGYIGAGSAICFPFTGLTPSSSGPGALVYATGSAPGAGAAANITLTGNIAVELVGLVCAFTTNATVATRQVYTVFQLSGGISIASNVANATQTASLTNTYYVNKFLGKVVAGSDIGMPDIARVQQRAASDLAITIGAYNIQAGDQFGAITAAYRQWINV